MRLRSDIWIAAYLRRVMAGGAFVAVRKKGEPSAGAIFIRIDRLNGTGSLFGPAPQAVAEDEHGGRIFLALHDAETMPNEMIDKRLTKETNFDPDCWIIEVEDRLGRSFLEGSLVQKDVRD
jgi:hypothetical protein